MIITIILFVLLIFLSGLLLYIKNRYDYQLSVLNIDEVKYKVCEYNTDIITKSVFLLKYMQKIMVDLCLEYYTTMKMIKY